MIKTCLFPVAGFGTRFLPATKSTPKELFPIMNKPLIHYAVLEASNAGMENMCFITNKYKASIQKYFSKHSYLESVLVGTGKEKELSELNQIIASSSFSFKNQEIMLGLGHAILQGRELIGNNPFAVILPDDLCFNDSDSVLQQLINVYYKNPYKCILAIEEVDNINIDKYGIIDATPILDSDNLYSVVDMVEKPKISEAPSNLAVIGRYILSPEIFDILENTLPGTNNEIQVTDALRVLAKQGKVLALKFNGKRLDCGTPEGYISANNFYKKLN